MTDSTDRELLEMAAKAAGLTVDPNTMGCARWTVRNDRGDIFDWNPLHDDGDVLRLAVKLDMTVRFYGQACAQATRPGGPSAYESASYEGQDAGSRMRAARRAITRAAAEIGRTKT